MYTAVPQQASNFVAGVDLAFMVILGISIFFLIGLTVLMIVFIYKYRKDKHPKAIQNEGSTRLETNLDRHSTGPGAGHVLFWMDGLETHEESTG